MMSLKRGLSALAILSSVSVVLVPTTHAAAAMTLADVHSSAKLATDLFQSEQAAHAPHFTGYKAWIAADLVKVKVYVNHDGMAMEFNYSCHHHDDGDLECHDQ